MAYDRLTAQDAAFLHLESASTPMHVGSLALLEGAPFFDGAGRFRLDEVRAHIAARLHLAPRFRQRLATVPLSQGRPIWVDDEAFDIEHHVRHTALPNPGDESQLLALVGRIQAQLLDRRRPLWEAWFVENVEGDRVAFILKTHHAMVDGIAGVDLASVLLDAERTPVPVTPLPWQPSPPPNRVKLLVDSVVERATQPAEALRSVRAALRGPKRVLDRAIGTVRAVEEMGRVVSRLPFNVAVGPQRRVDLVRVSLDDAKRVRRAFGVTVNDVVLAAVAGGVRRYLLERGEHVDDLSVRVMVPVSMRAEDHDARDLGNRVSAVFAALPVDEADPVRRLERVRDEMAHLKTSGEVAGTDALLSLTGWFPPTIFALASRLVRLQRFVNLVVTNVPGPQVPMYAFGARLLEAFPYVGVIDNMAVTVGVLSYDGQLGFALTADGDAVPDVGVLAEGIEKSMTEVLSCVR
jgi:WS/DGAT/MGAT family acyltransferase